MNTLRGLSLTRMAGRVVLACTVLLACSAAHAKELKIVTTTADLGSIASAVAGDRATVRSICTGKDDPHFLQAKPSYIMMARDADLWIRVGMELEIGWETPVLDGARNRRIRVGNRGHLDVSERVLRLEVPSTRVTRAMGDVHPHGNPHYWLDPLNARIVAQTIADRLAEIAPQDADVLRGNLEAFQKALDERMFGKELVARLGGDKLWTLALKGTLFEFLDERQLAGELGGWQARMRPHAGAKIVTYHRSWTYFAHRFGLQVVAEVEPKPGIPPSPGHLVRVIDTVQAEGVGLILLEPFYSRASADMVAAKTGAIVAVCANSVDGEAAASDYLALMDLVVDRVSGALEAGAPNG